MAQYRALPAASLIGSGIAARSLVPTERIMIELSGGQHAEQPRADTRRDAGSRGSGAVVAATARCVSISSGTPKAVPVATWRVTINKTKNARHSGCRGSALGPGFRNER